MKNFVIISLAVTLFTACSKDSADINPGTTDNVTSNNEKSLVTRPFSASINAVADTDPSIPPTACSGDLPGFAAPDFILSGTAAHMGQLDIQNSRLHHNDCNLSFSTAQLTTNVSGQLAAANGDLIYYNGDDIVNVINLLTQAGTTGEITGTWTITGGTGRFENATGSFTIDGIVDLVGNSFSCQCNGTITY